MARGKLYFSKKVLYWAGRAYPAAFWRYPALKKLISAFFDKKFLKFCLVGAANTLVGAGVMFLLYNVAYCSCTFSSAMNYVVGSILSYLLNKYFTFEVKEYSVKQVLRFALNIAVCYAVAYGLAKPFAVWLLSDASVKVQDNVAMLVGMVVFTGLNYIGQRFFAFAKKGEKPLDKEGKS